MSENTKDQRALNGLMKRNRWNQAQLAEFLGVSNSSISQWRRGRVEVPGVVSRLLWLLTHQTEAEAAMIARHAPAPSGRTDAAAWDVMDIEDLRRLVRGGSKYREMARLLGRSTDSVKSQIRRLRAADTL